MFKKIILLGIIAIFSVSFMTGCNNSTNKIMNVDIENVKQFAIYQGENKKIIDLQNSENKKFLELFSNFLLKTGKDIGTLDGSLELSMSEIEEMMKEEKENYYIFIEFKEPQTISFKDNDDEIHDNCDLILFDTDKMILNWSMNKEFLASMGYTDNTEEMKKEFVTILNLMKEYLSKN